LLLHGSVSSWYRSRRFGVSGVVVISHYSDFICFLRGKVHTTGYDGNYWGH
jgi:hypothetical protein